MNWITNFIATIAVIGVIAYVAHLAAIACVSGAATWCDRSGTLLSLNTVRSIGVRTGFLFGGLATWIVMRFF